MLPEAMFPDHNSYMAYLRDWFAGQALAGLCAAPYVGGYPSVKAQDAYQIADAMLAERSK